MILVVSSTGKRTPTSNAVPDVANPATNRQARARELRFITLHFWGIDVCRSLPYGLYTASRSRTKNCSLRLVFPSGENRHGSRG